MHRGTGARIARCEAVDDVGFRVQVVKFVQICSNERLVQDVVVVRAVLEGIFFPPRKVRLDEGCHINPDEGFQWHLL